MTVDGQVVPLAARDLQAVHDSIAEAFGGRLGRLSHAHAQRFGRRVGPQFHQETLGADRDEVAGVRGRRVTGRRLETTATAT